MIIFGNVEHGRKIARKVGTGFDPDVHYVVSRVRNYELLGGVLYTDYTGPSVVAHIAGFHPRWMTPQLLWVMHDFPFSVLKVRKIFVFVLTSNQRSMGIAQKMGFEWVTTIPDVAPGGDLDVLSLSRKDCRWLRLGKRYSAGQMENAA